MHSRMRCSLYWWMWVCGIVAGEVAICGIVRYAGHSVALRQLVTALRPPSHYALFYRALRMQLHSMSSCPKLRFPFETRRIADPRVLGVCLCSSRADPSPLGRILDASQIGWGRGVSSSTTRSPFVKHNPSRLSFTRAIRLVARGECLQSALSRIGLLCFNVRVIIIVVVVIIITASSWDAS